MRQPAAIHWAAKLFRVVRRGWTNPLDTSFSRRSPDPRWNTAEFGALYCCGSEPVARAVALDVFRLAGVVMADLREEFRPRLVEIRWSGDLVDVYSARSLAAAGLPGEYPAGIDKKRTRALASKWHDAGMEGVLCRSASLARMGQSSWREPAAARCEVALWPANWERRPVVTGRRNDDRWLLPPANIETEP